MGAALAAAHGGNLLILGANVAGQCLGAGLVDEVMIFVVPVVLGGGVRLFGSGVRKTLELVDASTAGQVVILRYRGER